MSISDRDRKILLLLVPIALALAYWFLLLAPQREEQTKLQDQLTQAQSERDTAEQAASALGAAKRNFATDYAAVIYLGKSIPSTVDMPSLIVQLDRAARGTGIEFTSMQTGARVPATPAADAAAAPTTPGAPPPAASAPGAAAQGADNAVASSNAASTPAAGATPADPAAGGTAPAPSAALEKVPLDFQFDGSFFDLADFFHRMKRFVRVANEQIIVRGRLMTIDSFSFDSSDSFPSLKATVHASVYLAPKAQGVSAGASQAGPAASTAPNGQQTASSKSSTSPTPAATVTAR